MKTVCPLCKEPHDLSQCPRWREQAGAIGYRLLPVALAPHIKDALVETGGCFMPETVWAAIIAAHDLVAPGKPVTWPPVVWKTGPLAMPPEGVTVDVVPLGPERSETLADEKSIRDYPDFREDLERLSEPGLAKAQAKVIRRAIYDTIDARVRNLSAAQSQASAAPVLTDADKQDAERWRAFLNSARIRIIGTAGIREPEGGYAHLGMEIWTIYGASLDAEQMQRMRDGNAYAREVLTKYADIAIERHLAAIPAKTEG